MEQIIYTIESFLNMFELAIYKIVNVLSSIEFFNFNLFQIIVIFTLFCNIALFIMYMVGGENA